jgi:arginine decarboxylase-like protein
VFQSLLDHWALGALFPIVPMHRLNESRLESTLVDITCDSDGKVSKFIDLNDVRDTLPCTRPAEGPYYLGIFLTGAYQDIMGDLHNLFGRVNEVHVFLDDDEDCGYYVEETIAGHTISEVLGMTQYDNARPRREGEGADRHRHQAGQAQAHRGHAPAQRVRARRLLRPQARRPSARPSDVGKVKKPRASSA